MIDAIRPYTYHLFHIPTEKHYYGVRWANKIVPEKDLWVEYFSSSKKVKRLIEEYGKGSFKIEIRKIFNNKFEALSWENRVLKRLKVVENPNWLNETYNDRRSKETQAKALDSRMKRVYKLVSPKGEIFFTRNLKEFSEKYDLDSAQLVKVASGRFYSSRMWKVYIVGKEHLRNKIEEKWKNGDPRKQKFSENKRKKFNDKQIQTYLIISPLGEKFYNKSLKYFCSIHDLSYSTMNKIANGKIYSHKGWMCYIIGKENLREPIEEKYKEKKSKNESKKKINLNMSGEKNGFFNKHHSKETKVHLSNKHLKYEYRLIDQNNQIYIISNLTQFCKIHNLSNSAMSAMVKGKYYQYKGWVGYIVGKEYLRNKIEEQYNEALSYSACSPDGIYYEEISNFRIFCEDNHLNYKTVLTYIKRKSYKNWQFFVKEK